MPLQGNVDEVPLVTERKGWGGGVYEYRVNFGPGYRIYFWEDSERIVILLAGGTKKRQASDIDRAIERWQDYRRRRKG